MELGRLYGSARKYDQALAKLNAGLAVNPKNVVTAASNLAWILYKRGVYQRALALLREGAARLPDNPELQYHLGMAAVRTGDKDVARKALAFAAGSAAVFKGQDEARKTLAELK